MKKTTKFFLLLTAFFILGTVSQSVNATQYCQTPIIATDGVTSVKLSCQSISEGNYQIKIESETVMNGLSAGCYCHTSNGDKQLIALSGYLLSTDGKTITVDIPSTTAPVPYTPLYVLIPGEKNFTWPTDIAWGTCGTMVTDNEAPTAFNAAKGAVTATSVELLLNGTDNSGSVTYTITYGATTVSTIGTSAVEKSYVITGLTGLTGYSFSVIAKDGSGNVAANNPIVIEATTTEDTNTECVGTSTVNTLTDGIAFTSGYSYGFTTSGTDVTVTFKCLDTKSGLVAYLWNRTSGFVETQMTGSEDQTFTITLADQIEGTTLTLACKFAFAGGASATKDFTYTVGDDCSDDVHTAVSAVASMSDISCYPNPASDKLVVNAKSEMSQLTIRNLVGQTVKTVKTNSLEKSIDLSAVSAGNYIITIQLANGKISNQKLIKL